MAYIDRIEHIALDDVAVVKKKDAEYGGSWQKRGGVGAFMMACRKWDRLEQLVQRFGYDVFQAAVEDSREEGILDDLRDLRGYLLLIEAEIRERQATVTSPMRKEDGPRGFDPEQDIRPCQPIAVSGHWVCQCGVANNNVRTTCRTCSRDRAHGSEYNWT